MKSTAKRAFCLLLAILCLTALAGCGKSGAFSIDSNGNPDTDSEDAKKITEMLNDAQEKANEFLETITDEDARQQLFNGLKDKASSLGKDAADKAMDKLETAAKDVATDKLKKLEARFTSYEEIYNNYSQQLKGACTDLQEKIKEEATGAGKEKLAEIESDTLNELAEIAGEGTELMAYKAKKNAETAADYMEWATKLGADYLEQAEAIVNACQEAAKQ